MADINDNFNNTLADLRQQNSIIVKSLDSLTSCINAFSKSTESNLQMTSQLMDRLYKLEANLTSLCNDHDRTKKDVDSTKIDLKNTSSMVINQDAKLSTILAKVTDMKDASDKNTVKLENLETKQNELSGQPAKNAYETFKKVTFEIVKYVAIAGVAILLTRLGIK